MISFELELVQDIVRAVDTVDTRDHRSLIVAFRIATTFCFEFVFELSEAELVSVLLPSCAQTTRETTDKETRLIFEQIIDRFFDSIESLSVGVIGLCRVEEFEKLTLPDCKRFFEGVLIEIFCRDVRQYTLHHFVESCIQSLSFRRHSYRRAEREVLVDRGEWG